MAADERSTLSVVALGAAIALGALLALGAVAAFVTAAMVAGGSF